MLLCGHKHHLISIDQFSTLRHWRPWELVAVLQIFQGKQSSRRLDFILSSPTIGFLNTSDLLISVVPDRVWQTLIFPPLLNKSQWCLTDPIDYSGVLQVSIMVSIISPDKIVRHAAPIAYSDTDVNVAAALYKVPLSLHSADWWAFSMVGPKRMSHWWLFYLKKTL